MALGITQQLPLDDKYTYSKPYLEAQLSVLFGGRASEELLLDQMTTGAGNDLDRASSIARKMVCEWGMSSLGPLSFGKKDNMIFLGRDIMSHPEHSEDTSKKIDAEIRKIIDKAYKNSKRIIMENKDKLEKIAKLLLEKESLNINDINPIIYGKKHKKVGINSKKQVEISKAKNDKKDKSK